MNHREEIIESNMGLVYACANRFKGRGIEYDDIFQNGCLGLIKAADAFDDKRGVRFSTYAVPFILGEIKRLFRESGSVKVGRRIKDLSIKLRRKCDEYLAQNGRSPTVGELAEMFNISTEQIVQALDASQAPMSITSASEDEDNQIDIPIEFNDESISNKMTIAGILESMSKDDRTLIYLRFFKGTTQTNTAKILGRTQVQISRREKILLKIMREKLA